jgi:hypothetical protein
MDETIKFLTARGINNKSAKTADYSRDDRQSRMPCEVSVTLFETVNLSEPGFGSLICVVVTVVDTLTIGELLKVISNHKVLIPPKKFVNIFPKL